MVIYFPCSERLKNTRAAGVGGPEINYRLDVRHRRNRGKSSCVQYLFWRGDRFPMIALPSTLTAMDVQHGYRSRDLQRRAQI